MLGPRSLIYLHKHRLDVKQQAMGSPSSQKPQVPASSPLQGALLSVFRTNSRPGLTPPGTNTGLGSSGGRGKAHENLSHLLCQVCAWEWCSQKCFWTSRGQFRFAPPLGRETEAAL